jgi:hypothetical protein
VRLCTVLSVWHTSSDAVLSLAPASWGASARSACAASVDAIVCSGPLFASILVMVVCVGPGPEAVSAPPFSIAAERENSRALRLASHASSRVFSRDVSVPPPIAFGRRADQACSKWLADLVSPCSLFPWTARSLAYANTVTLGVDIIARMGVPREYVTRLVWAREGREPPLPFWPLSFSCGRQPRTDGLFWLCALCSRL